MAKRKREKDNCQSHDVVGEDQDEEDVIWIQCENKSCLKWRQVSPEEADEIGEGSWYCWMNKDEEFCNCSIPEKKAKIGKGLKFVYSLLPLGEVVMAKMPGYPLWPGLLTPDPSYGEYYDALLDKETEPTQYHVEFLGEHHSRAWLTPRFVHPYNYVSEEDKMIPLSGNTASKLLTYYRSALDEARSLLPLTTKRRLQLANHFKVDPKIYLLKAASEDSNRAPTSSDVKQESEPFPSSTNEMYSDLEYQKSEESDNDRDCNSVASSDKGSKRKPPRQRQNVEDIPQDPSRKRTFTSDEKKFFENVKGVFHQRGLPPPKQPTWRGQHISLLALHNAVHQQGGFESVCKDKKWGKIYNMLVSSSRHAMGGTVRLFYQRHLLPYEMFIRGPHLSSEIDRCVSDVSETTVSSTSHLSPVPCIKEEHTWDHSSPASEGEQKVPDVRHQAGLSQQRGIYNHEVLKVTSGAASSSPVSPVTDYVPSSYPNTPLSNSFAALIPSSDSEDDDDDMGLECNAAEYELQQLERLLSSIEPSLYPPQGSQSPEKKRLTEVSTSPSPSLLNKKDDVLKTLDEMARIEGAIAELDTMVSLELENL